MHQPPPRQHRNTETQKPRTTTTTVASISVTFEPDDNWTVITVRKQDDLPAHVKCLRNPTSSRVRQRRLVPPCILSTLRCIQNQSKRSRSHRKQIWIRLVDGRRINTTKSTTTATTHCLSTTTTSISQPQWNVQSTTRIL